MRKPIKRFVFTHFWVRVSEWPVLRCIARAVNCDLWLWGMNQWDDSLPDQQPIRITPLSSLLTPWHGRDLSVTRGVLRDACSGSRPCASSPCLFLKLVSNVSKRQIQGESLFFFFLKEATTLGLSLFCH